MSHICFVNFRGEAAEVRRLEAPIRFKALVKTIFYEPRARYFDAQRRVEVSKGEKHM